jgi:hypothetical protein
MKPLRRGVIWVAAALALAAVFSLYLHGDFLRVLADQVWACF